MRIHRAAICEDEPEILQYISNHLKHEFSNQNVEITFDCFTSGTQLLNATKQEFCYSILFLDIEMPGINGIDLCRKIDLAGADTIVVFISNKEELVFQTFEVRPFRFIRKNHFLNELPRLVKDLIQELSRKKEHLLVINELHSNTVYSFNINEILYVEVLSKRCRVKTQRGEISFRYKLSDMEEQLTPFGFLRPHRSFLVNYNYISCIGKDTILLDNKEKIPLSRTRIDTIRQQFLQLTHGGTL